jgi:hypothetical protein
MMKRWKAILLHKWNVFLWEREVKYVANVVAGLESIQKGTIDYQNLIRVVANNEVVTIENYE